jgi:hypothetical protein
MDIRNNPMTTPILRCPVCQDELHKRPDGKLVCLEKTCKEFKKEIEPAPREDLEFIGDDIPKQEE